YDVATGKMTAVFLKRPSGVLCVRVAPDGAHAATGEADGTVRIWSLAADPQAARRLERPARYTLKGHRGPVLALAFTSDGKRRASAGQEGTVQFSDVNPGKSFSLATGPVHVIAFSSDAKRLATSGEDRAIRVWDASSGELRFVLPKQSAPVRALLFVEEG